MGRSHGVGEAGGRGSVNRRIFVFVLMVIAALSYGKGNVEKVFSADLNTSMQHIKVEVPTSAQHATIKLEQVESLQAIDLPAGFTAVANIQVFSDPEKTAEIWTFSPPLTVQLWPAEGKDKVISFGLLAKRGDERTWIVWNPKERAEVEIRKFANAGFDIAKFIPGNPAKLRVSRWPPGDPGCSH
jgi:hypothetical protein